MLALWLMVFSYLARFELTRKILQTFPDQCSFNMFKESGPTKEQMDQASYVYWFLGTGWETKLADPKEQHTEKPNAKIFIRCEGPGGPYLTTCGCVLSAAFTILQDRDALPSTYLLL
uniref:Uncharacterized protein n=1 Tax=Plectus sambesii TaxID=2011161 RepID=A0A914UYG6_9BILA